MPRLTHKLPSYRRHRPSGQAVVTLGGRDHYLGRHGTPESKTRYEQLIAEWLASHRQLPISPTSAPSLGLSINELFLVYWEHARAYYKKGGRPTSQPGLIRLACRPLSCHDFMDNHVRLQLFALALWRAVCLPVVVRRTEPPERVTPR